MAYIPTLFAVASLRFLAATVWQTVRMSVKVWKGILLPLVVADLDKRGEVQGGGGDGELDELESRAGQSRVVLENEGKRNLIFRVP